MEILNIFYEISIELGFIPGKSALLRKNRNIKLSVMYLINSTRVYLFR